MRWILASAVAAVAVFGAAFGEPDVGGDPAADGVWLQQVLVEAGFWGAGDVDPRHPWNHAISTGGPHALDVWLSPGRAGRPQGRPIDDGVRVRWEAQGLRIWAEPTGPWDAHPAEVERLIQASLRLPRGSPGPAPPPACRARRLPRAPAGLPAPVELWTRCGVFVVDPEGRITKRAGTGRWRDPRDTRRLAVQLPPPRRRPRQVAVYSGVVPDSSGTLEAFTATEGYRGLSERGFEVVYVRVGGRIRTVHGVPMRFTICGRAVQLSWHGSWLLYGAGEGHAAAIHVPTGRVIDLSAVIRRLPGTQQDSHAFRLSSATWA